MARTKTSTNQTELRSDVCKYKTAASEERAIMRRLRAHRAKRMKEMEGMTGKEQIDYMNRLGEEAMARMGITKFTKAQAGTIK